MKRTSTSKRRPAPRRHGPAGNGGRESIVAAVGKRVKRLRGEAALSLEQLATQSGVSRAMLSKVERGEKSATLAILAGIAAGLEVSMSALLGAEPDEADVAVIPASKRLTFRDPETGFVRHVLSPTHLHNGVELVLHQIPPGGSSGVLPPYKEPTEKYLVVHQGDLTVYIGESAHALRTGDSLYFEVKTPYRFVNEGRKPCAYYMAIVRKR